MKKLLSLFIFILNIVSYSDSTEEYLTKLYQVANGIDTYENAKKQHEKEVAKKFAKYLDFATFLENPDAFISARDGKTKVDNSTNKGSFNNKKYAVKVYKAALEYQDKYYNSEFPLYKEIANKHGVKVDDLKDLGVVVLKEGIGGVVKREKSVKRLDGNKYMESKYNRIIYGDFIDSIYQELHNIAKNGIPNAPKNSNELVKMYPGISDIVSNYRSRGIDTNDIAVQCEVFLEILKSDYLKGRTTLKTSDPTTAKVFTRAGLLSFSLDTFTNYEFIEDVIDVWSLNLNQQIHTGSVDKTKDLKGTITEEEFYVLYRSYINSNY